MRTSAIAAFLLAGLTATVAAQPDKKETVERVSLIDVGKDAPEATLPADDDGWVELADPTPTKHGKVFISVGAGAGTFSKLRLDAAKGKPYVKMVKIDFKDGPSRVVRLGKSLSKTKPTYVDLRGAREIQQIVVYGEPKSNGTYTVHAAADESSGVVATR